MAFGNGRDTFGWRFFPRFATEKKTATKVAKHRIDPGMRECTALVILPSFLPAITINTRSRWFGLDCPEKTEPKIERMYNLAERWRTLGAGSTSGTANQVMFSWDQNSGLPFQTMGISLPYETALGGYTLLNDQGVGSLGPDLFGSYGDPVTDGTNDFTVYLVGNNFSVRGTQVIASGVPIANLLLLSRQLMEVTLPGSMIRQTNQLELVVATPYGVSSPLAIKPTYTGKPAGTSKSGYTWRVDATNTTMFTVQITVSNNIVAFPILRPDDQNPFPHIVRTLSSGSDAIMLPDSAKMAFKLSFVSGGAETPLSNPNNLKVMNVTQAYGGAGTNQLASWRFYNNQMLTPEDWCANVWPAITNFVGKGLDHLCVSNVFPTGASLKLAAYLRLDSGIVVSADDPLVMPLSQ